MTRHRANERIFLYAFDLIELNGDDLRRDPLEVRKATLASIVAKAGPGIRFNEHTEGDCPTVFAHACKMGLEALSRSGREGRRSPGAGRAERRRYGCGLPPNSLRNHDRAAAILSDSHAASG